MQGLDFARLPMVSLACLLLTLGLMASFAWQRPFGSGRWRRYYWLVVTQFLFYPATIAVGVIYRVGTGPTQTRPEENTVADWTLAGLFFLSLALGIFWVYRMKGLRWFAFCLVALLQLFLLAQCLWLACRL